MNLFLSETPKTGFGAMRPKYCITKQGSNAAPPKTMGASIKMGAQQQNVRLEVRRDSSLSHWGQA